MRRVLDVLADGPVSLPRLESDSGLRRGRLETLLKVLDVEGAVERVDGGWMATGRPWQYDHARHEGIAAARRREQQAMLRYERVESCLMQQLRHQLDDDTDAACGRCAWCTGRLPAPGTTPSTDTVRAAVTHLRSQHHRARTAQDVADGRPPARPDRRAGPRRAGPRAGRRRGPGVARPSSPRPSAPTSRSATSCSRVS